MNISTTLQMKEWSINPLKNELTYQGKRIRIEAKQMQVLLYFYDNPGRTISLQELNDRVWSGKVVGYHAIYRVINQLRKTLKIDLSQGEWITTYPKKGYRLNWEKTKDLEATQEPSPKKSKRKPNNLIVFGLLLLSLILLVFYSSYLYFVNFNLNDSNTLPHVGVIKDSGSLIAPLFSFDETRLFSSTTTPLTIESNTKLNIGRNNISISSWIKTTKPFGTIIYKRDLKKPVIGYLFMVYNGQLLLQLADKSNGWANYVTKLENPINDNQWHHVAISFNRLSSTPSLTFYLNGESVLTLTDNLRLGDISNDSSALIGKHDDNRFDFEGMISQLDLMDDALTDTQIKSLYLAGKQQRVE